MARSVTCPFCGYEFRPANRREKWPGDYFEMCAYCCHWQEEPPPGKKLAEHQNGWCGEHQDGAYHTGHCQAFRPDGKWRRA